MKIFLIVILSTLIHLAFSQSNCLTATTSAAKKNCNSVEFSEAEKTAGYKYCCYVEYESSKACVPYNQDLYDAIGKTKKSDIKGKIECNSSYLKIFLISLILFVF